MFKFSNYICILSLVVTPILFKQNLALAGGGFTASCRNIAAFVFTNHEGYSPLQAQCYTKGGQLSSYVFLDLNSHITNNNGTLAWQKDGGFAASVRNCGLDISNVTILHCKAAKNDGSYVDASITLDDEIANSDGNLTVNGFQAADNLTIGLIYDKNDTDLAKTAAKAKNGKGITSVTEAVTAAKDLASQGKFDALILVGHGASGSIGLGSGTENEYVKGKELRYNKLNDVSDDLNSLKESLKPDSYVILSSCYTGKEPDGLNFVKQLSEKLPDSYIFANTNCVGLTSDPSFKKNSVCSVDGDKQWQKSSIVAAKGNKEVDVDRDLYKKLTGRLCVPTK